MIQQQQTKRLEAIGNDKVMLEIEALLNCSSTDKILELDLCKSAIIWFRWRKGGPRESIDNVWPQVEFSSWHMFLKTKEGRLWDNIQKDKKNWEFGIKGNTKVLCEIKMGSGNTVATVSRDSW